MGRQIRRQEIRRRRQRRMKRLKARVKALLEEKKAQPAKGSSKAKSSKAKPDQQ